MLNTKVAGPVGTFIIGIIFTLGGFLVTYLITWPNYQLAKKSVSWPQVTGTILESRVDSRHREDEMQYRAYINYSYEVDGQNYKSSQIYMGSGSISSSDPEDAHQYVNKYPVGKMVTVYYAPEKIAMTVLEPGANRMHYILLGVGILFAVCGILALFKSIFKLAILATAGGVILSSLLSKNKEDKGSTKSRRNKNSINSRIDHQDHNIDLDDEMLSYNKVSSANLAECEEPWKYKWMVKGTNKNYGPYSFEKLLDYFKRGKVKEGHKCYTTSGGNTVKIKDIVHKRGSYEV